MMRPYDPAFPQLSISTREDEHGRVIGLDFHRRTRRLTDGIDLNELDERAALRAAERQKAAPGNTAMQAAHKKRPQTQEGEMPPGWFGRKDRIRHE